jgi:DNA-binding NtrC family response regulator
MAASVLIVDDDQDVSALVADVLQDAGFRVSRLTHAQSELIRAEVGRLEPDVVLLDGSDKLDYGEAWADAAWLHERERAVAAIMFTGHAKDLEEGQQHETQRSRRAAFVGFIGKPFDLDTLVTAVRRAARDASSVKQMSC